MGTRLHALVAVVSLAIAMPAHAGPATPATAATDPAADEAAQLFDEGAIRYQTADYIGAVDFFTRAFKHARDIKDDKRRESAMMALLFNLGRAHRRAYDVDHDPSHLRQARELLKQYVEREIDEKDPKQLLSEIEEMLADLEASRAGGAGDESSGPTAGPQASTAAQDKPKTSPLMIAGIVTASLSAAGIALLGAGVGLARGAERDFEDGPQRDDRLDARDRGSTGNALIITGAATAGALLVAGVGMIVGAKLKQRKTATSLLPAPTLGGVAIMASRRF